MQPQQVFIVLLILVATIKSGCKAIQDTSNASSPSRPGGITDDQIKQNEIHVDDDDKDRIRFKEPYKSLIQTTVRLSLSQSSLANHLNIDSIMDVINRTAYTMSKASTLIKVMKIAAIVMGLLLSSLLLYPPLLKNLMHDPMHLIHFEKFLNNGTNEKSILGMLSSTTDNFLNTIGFRDYTCRERSLCYAGEVLRCSFPNTAEAVTKFASSNFSNISLSDHKYVKAFVTGFLEKNCAKIGNGNMSCLSSLFF